jgi:hypothetical protein
MAAQRQATATWIVQRMTGVARLRSDCNNAEAVDVAWLLMDPAVFVRPTRERQWSMQRYQRWIADALARLLVIDLPAKDGKK